MSGVGRNFKPSRAPRQDPIKSLIGLLLAGNRAQVKYEHKQAIVHLLMGGPLNAMGGPGRGKQMSYKNAQSIAWDAVYNRLKHPRH